MDYSTFGFIPCTKDQAKAILAESNHLREAWSNGEVYFEMYGRRRVDLLFHLTSESGLPKDDWFRRAMRIS